MKCECKKSGWCSRFRRTMSQRAWELCSRQCPAERPCPSLESSVAYQALWASEIQAWSWIKFWQPWEKSRADLDMFLRFVKAWFQHILAGLPHATVEQQSVRRSQCNRCPQFNMEKDECKECGCKLGAVKKKGTKRLMYKTLWAREQCPLWQASGPRPACQPVPPEGGWGPVDGVTLWQRVWSRLLRRG